VDGTCHTDNENSVWYKMEADHPFREILPNMWCPYGREASTTRRL
jgi:hypothetical protein